MIFIAGVDPVSLLGQYGSNNDENFGPGREAAAIN